MNARAATRSYLSANRRVERRCPPPPPPTPPPTTTHHHNQCVHRRGTFISAGARPLMCIPCKYYPRPARPPSRILYTYATAHSLAVAAMVPKLIGRNRPPILCRIL